MTDSEMLKAILQRLDRLCAALDPFPGYRQDITGQWRDGTGESMYDKMQREHAELICKHE